MAKITHRIIQGDSFAYDFWSTDVPLLDATWTGSWSILTSIGGTVESSGTLVLSADLTKLELRIIPADTNTLLNDYILVVQIDNVPLDFRQEAMQDKFVVAEQGI